MGNDSYRRFGHRAGLPGLRRRSATTNSALGLLVAVSVILAAGCAAPESLSIDQTTEVPSGWQSEQAADAVAEQLESPGWLAGFDDERLELLVLEAMVHNPDLAAARARVEQAHQAVVITGADRYPGLGLSYDLNRPESGATSFSLAAGFSWDVDIWGELSARQRQAQLEYASAEAELKQSRETLAADISRAWFRVQETQLLLKLFRERSDNLKSDLAVIESGYRQGLYEALDLYLARNDLNAQLATVEEQALALAEAKRTLEQLLGRYPAAALSSEETLPVLETELPLVLPSEMVVRRPDLQVSWLNLLAADEGLAAAHRARFPGFSLSAEYGGSSDDLSELVSSGNLAWLLGASLTQPLFDAGRLRAQQDQQLARRQELEQNYLSNLYTAFSEVENALDGRGALAERYRLYLNAEENALQAEQLAFERYQRGLEEFTTVLESQRRSLDAQTNVIQLRRSLLENRVALAVALGGSFDAPANDRSTSDNPSQAEAETTAK
ncbi:efflux transporter outer membrane subunit [Marinobacterium lutimaris]|uniref:Efflux transporter, outer membrane factor (OMF) lipoprotein, NodT family n=1 Tax=Marinobacterium lutimaris TaxID=568106 RepID=A0A1H6AHL0_9GAMM|nr:efflux transporter outer membrane subunit [Marinobacterium lutimaris]SEG47882.1 efflux transporter, outer membrane factor (OMF) lipoprotein, NodT family [Marinobacterium lutimaris]